MKIKSYLLFALMISFFLFNSCTKEDVPAKTISKTTDNSAVVASTSIDLINELDIQTGNEVSYTNLTKKKANSSITTSCSNVIMDPVTSEFPKTYYVDFGTGCSINNITRKGKLKVTFSNYVTETGSTMTIERMNYYINGNKVEGKIVYKNITNSAKTPQWTRTVSDGIFTNVIGEVFLNSGTHTVKQTAGVETLSIDDNSFEITEGTHTVTKKNGDTITLTVLQALLKNNNCYYISKGKLTVQSVLLNGVIDYGAGECDNKATYTQNGIEFPLTM